MNARVHFEPVRVRASGLAELFDCPARWEAKHIKKIYSPSSGAARLGTAIHAGAEAFDLARLNGGSITLDDAAGVAVDVLHGKDEEVNWGTKNPRKLEEIAISLTTKYCYEIAPKYKFLGVELTCEPLVIEDLGIELTGTIDRLYEAENLDLGIGDLKSGVAAVNAYDDCKVSAHGPQMGIYEVLVQNHINKPIKAPALIFGLNAGNTPHTQRFAVGEIHNARVSLLGDDEHMGSLEYASQIIHSGLFYGNPRSMLCSATYCPAHGTCKFKG
jgi:hypothetical protein